VHKAIKGALIGSVVGGGVAAVQATRAPDPDRELAPDVLKGAAEGAAVGAGVGFFLQWRSNRKAASSASARRKGVARLTGPFSDRVESAVERAIDAAEAALPHVEEFTERASASLFEIADATRPHVRSLTEAAREKAFDLTEVALESARPRAAIARAKAEELAEQAIDLAEDLAEAAREKASDAGDDLRARAA
jgi:hypothetical protein